MYRAHHITALAASLFMTACSGSLSGKGTKQGLHGSFSMYSAPAQLRDCSPFTAYDDREACKKENERVLEEPFRGVIRIRNVSTGIITDQTLDEQGAYRVILSPGQYEVCVEGECSDPIEVRMGNFGTYGQRMPKPAADTVQSAAPGAVTPAPGAVTPLGDVAAPAIGARPGAGPASP